MTEKKRFNVSWILWLFYPEQYLPTKDIMLVLSETNLFQYE